MFVVGVWWVVGVVVWFCRYFVRRCFCIGIGMVVWVVMWIFLVLGLVC